jgi:PilZ domain-containing protein
LERRQIAASESAPTANELLDSIFDLLFHSSADVAFEEDVMTDTGAERRNFARERTHIEVEILKDLKRLKGIMEYVSFGGAFISLPKTFLPDSNLEVQFEVPGEYAPFKGNAKVVWVKKDKAIGIEFVDLPDSEKLKLEKFLMSL